MGSTPDEWIVVVKRVNHFRLQNERDVLLRFQSRISHIRQLHDKVDLKPNPPALILKYLQHDLLSAMRSKKLTRSEVKFIGKGVLEALRVLHEDGFVHTGQSVLPRPVVLSYSICITKAHSQTLSPEVCSLT